MYEKNLFQNNPLNLPFQFTPLKSVFIFPRIINFSAAVTLYLHAKDAEATLGAWRFQHHRQRQPQDGAGFNWVENAIIP